MSFLKTFAKCLPTIGLAASLLPFAAAAQQNMDDVVIKTINLTPNIHMLMGRGGNIAVITGADGAVLIDDQFAPLTKKIIAAVKAIDSGELRYVINTHWHGDHTGGNENLGKAGLVIVAHDNVRKRMSADSFSKFFNRQNKAAAPEALPVITFTDTVTFHLNGEEIHAFHVAPAHTDGDTIIHFRTSNVIHTGDTYFARTYPFIDVESGGDINGVIAAAGEVLAIADDRTKIIPGHGPLSTKADLTAYRAMLVAVRDKVAALVEAGKSADQAVAAKPTADLDARWAGGFINGEKITRLVHASLSRHE